MLYKHLHSAFIELSRLKQTFYQLNNKFLFPFPNAQ